MKRKNLILIGVAAAVACALGVTACASVANNMRTNPQMANRDAEATTLYTLSGTTTGGTSGYAEYSSITQNGVSWKVMANTTMNPWRIGGKSLSNIEKPIYSETAISGDIEQIVIEFGAASSITVNSLTVGVYSTSSDAQSGTNPVSLLTPSFVANNTVSVDKPSGADWNNRFYRIVLKVTVTVTSNKFVEFKSAKFNGVGSAVSGVSLDGSMSVKSYTTVDSWNNAGLTASVSMNDGSSYSGTVSWSYDPSTPAAYVLNAGDEVTNGSVEATASAGDMSASKTTTGISVSYANVAQVTAATPASGTSKGVIAKGIVSQINEIETSQYYNATYFISDDGTTTNQYEVFHGKGVNNANFTNSNDLMVGDEVVVYGNITTYNGTKEFAQGSYLLSLYREETNDPTITITNSSFTIIVGDIDVSLHAEVENAPEGSHIGWESSSTSVATIVNDNDNYAVHAVGVGSATITAKILDSSNETLASNSITIYVVENVLEDEDLFVIKSAHDNEDYYLTGVESNLGTVSTEESDAMSFTAVESDKFGQFRLKNDEDSYLSYSGSSNSLSMTTNGSGDAALWTVTNNGSKTVIESVNVLGRKLQFNYNSGNPRFACYTTNQTAIVVEKITPSVTEYTVSFESNGGSTVLSQTINKNGVVAEPAAPTKENFVFAGWYSDQGLTSRYDFSTPVTSSFTLYAKWKEPAPLTTDVKVFVKVENTNELVDGKYLIAYEDGGVAFDGSRETLDAASNTVSPDFANYRFVTYNAKVESTYFTIETDAENSNVKYIKSASGTYVGRNTNSNGMDTSEEIADKVKNTISFDDDGNAIITGNAGGARLQYNKTSGQTRFRYFSSNQQAIQLYKYVDLDEKLDSFESIKALHAHENNDNGEVTVDSVAITLGAQLSKAGWDEIAGIWNVTDYGVKLIKKTNGTISSPTPVQDAIENKKSVATINKGSGVAPTAVEGMCSFEAQVNVTNYRTMFYAAPYIVVGEKAYFLDEINASVHSLAENYTGSDLSTDALALLLA